ncbi:uncharacterized protein LOC110018710 [Phalaenopsis equestris]|uniref:uncharacterized protein LOC110018710 n=1 Tax=Phalaenopsis equestris TaxID=78828 RepID=UPI0009E484A0|nr:uncharacterized protein LOC110018710 [Phalaenopsis equestris]
MAVSVTPSSIFTCSSVFCTTASLRRSLKLSRSQGAEGCKHGKQELNHFKGTTKSKIGFLGRRLSGFAISEDQSTYFTVKLENMEPEELEITAEDESAGSTLSPPVERTAGKPGFVSFHGLPYERRGEIPGASLGKERSRVFWFIGPTMLVAFLVLPSLYLRRVLSTFFEDSLLTDFLILFFTEALFYGGVAIFVLLVDYVWRPLKMVDDDNNNWSKIQFGLQISSVTTLALSLIIPLLTMGMVWPWTGPAASATLAPYLVGLVVQFAFEQYARHHKSPAWPVIPIIFQVYRLHQLNRAAQLVTALSISVRGTETTPQTLAINSSLGTLLTVLQILGVICIWSLSSFLMRFLPPSVASVDSR